MNGELAQIVALVSHGNDYLLRGDGGSPPALHKSNSTFLYVERVTFARYKRPTQSRGRLVCEGIDNWLRILRAEGAKRLWNVAFAWDRSDTAEHQATAFAGGVPRAIQADMPKGFELWYPAWRSAGGSQTPWMVEYRGLTFPKSQAFTAVDVASVRAHLDFEIDRARRFAGEERSTMSIWEGILNEASSLLSDMSPAIPYHPDMLPEIGFSLSDRQVLAAACKAFVFGGMGSWNDVGFEGSALQEKYTEITRGLYEAVKIAIVVASNQYQKMGPNKSLQLSP